MQPNYKIIFGIIAILISLVTWGMDLSGLVHICINCRIERTIIGILGLIMVVPFYSFLIIIFTDVIGFFGAFVASQQIFSILMHHTVNFELLMAICALIIIIAQVFFINYFSQQK